MFAIACSAWAAGSPMPTFDRRFEILSDLAAHEHRAAARDHGLAQIVVELLFRVGIAGIELT